MDSLNGQRAIDGAAAARRPSHQVHGSGARRSSGSIDAAASAARISRATLDDKPGNPRGQSAWRHARGPDPPVVIFISLVYV